MLPLFHVVLVTLTIPTRNAKEGRDCLVPDLTVVSDHILQSSQLTLFMLQQAYTYPLLSRTMFDVGQVQ